MDHVYGVSTNQSCGSVLEFMLGSIICAFNNLAINSNSIKPIGSHSAAGKKPLITSSGPQKPVYLPILIHQSRDSIPKRQALNRDKDICNSTLKSPLLDSILSPSYSRSLLSDAVDSGLHTR